MKFPYFFCVFPFNLLLFSTLYGQVTHTATIQLLLLNEQTGQPLETTIKWHEVKMNKDFNAGLL